MTTFLKSGTGLVTAATTLVIAVGGLLTAVSKLNGGEAKPAAVKGSPTVAAVSPSRSPRTELRSHIPAAILPKCGRPENAEPGAAAATNCSDGNGVNLQYNLFASPSAVRDDYARVKGAFGVNDLNASSCAQDGFEGDFERGGQPVGRLLCFVDRGEGKNWASIVWTDEGRQIVAFAYRKDPDQKALYDAFQTGFGPQ